MKKRCCTLLLSLLSLTCSAQQPRHALGVHIGLLTADLEYQCSVNENDFFDATAGLCLPLDGVHFSATYNWDICHWGSTRADGRAWSFWGGIGLAGGYNPGWTGLGSFWDEEGGYIGPAGNLGIKYTCAHVPMSVGFDYRPMIAGVVSYDPAILVCGLINFGLSVSVHF